MQACLYLFNSMLGIYGYVGLCMGMYGHVGFFIRSAMYILVARSAFKLDSGYPSKRSEPFL